MGEFFKGGRRKVGVATLVTACIVAGAWIRSQIVAHEFGVLIGRRWHKLTSEWGEIEWATESNKFPRPLLWDTWKLEGSPNHNAAIDHENSFLFVRYTTGATTVLGITSHSFCIIISYWAIVIPLTLLSAYLLLSKPRPATQKKTADPTPAEGT